MCKLFEGVWFVVLVSLAIVIFEHKLMVDGEHLMWWQLSNNFPRLAGDIFSSGVNELWL